MTAFSPVRLSELPTPVMFDAPRPNFPAGSPSRFWLARIYDGVVASWRHEPDLAEMGPSQINELLVMRGRDIG